MVIQQIPLGNNSNLYLLGIDFDENLITFKSPKGILAEPFGYSETEVQTTSYHFPLGFLYKFLEENDAINGKGEILKNKIIYEKEIKEEEKN